MHDTPMVKAAPPVKIAVWLNTVATSYRIDIQVLGVQLVSEYVQR